MTKKLTFKQQLAVLAVIVVAALGLYFYFVWQPQATRLASVDQQTEEEEVKMASAKATLTGLENLKRSAPKIEAKITKINKKIPKTPELPPFLVQLQNMANDASVSITQIKPGEPKDEAGFSRMEVDLQVSGSYMAIENFLFRLENAPRAMRVDQYSVRISDVKNYPKLESELTVSAFVMGGSGGTAKVPPVTQQGAGAAQQQGAAQQGTAQQGAAQQGAAQ